MPLLQSRLTYRQARGSYGVYGIVSRGSADPRRGLSQIAFGLLCIFVFTIAWENVLVVPGLGTVSKLAGAAAFGVGILSIIDSGHLRKLSGVYGLMTLFVLWGMFTFFWTESPDRTREELGTYLQLLLMVWIFHEIAYDKVAQTSLMAAYVLGTYVSSVSTLLAFQSGTAANYQRYSAQGFNPGDLALMLVLSIPFSFYLASIERRKLLLWCYRLQPVFAISAILLTAARGALIDLAVALLIVPLVLSKWGARQRLALAFVGVVAIAAIVSVVPASSWSRFGTIGKEVSSGNLNERTMIWKAGLEVFRSRPVEGIGVGAFAPVVQRALGTPRPLELGGPTDVVELVAHNTFISVLVEEGLVGFLLFVFMLINLWQGIFTLERLERRLWVVVMLVWTIGVMELTWEYRKPTWLLFGLLAATLSSASSKVRRRPNTNVKAVGPGLSQVGSRVQ